MAPYAMHSRITRVYQILKSIYWWLTMKKDAAEHVAKCLVYQQIKIVNQAPTGKLITLLVPEWKWEKIAMDFMSGRPKKKQ